MTTEEIEQQIQRFVLTVLQAVAVADQIAIAFTPQRVARDSAAPAGADAGAEKGFEHGPGQFGRILLRVDGSEQQGQGFAQAGSIADRRWRIFTVRRLGVGMHAGDPSMIARGDQNGALRRRRIERRKRQKIH